MIGAAVLVATSLSTAASGAQPAIRVPGCAPVPHPGGEWRAYGHDLSNTRTQPDEKAISAVGALTLAPVWTFSSKAAGGEGDFTGNPVVADGCMFVASNRGWVFAANADTGRAVWKAKLPRGGVNSTVTVAGGRVYAAVSSVSSRGGAGGGPLASGPYLTALDERTGRVRWRSAPIDGQPGADVYGSPVVWDGMVVIGVSGGSAELGNEADRYAFEGSFVILDADNGARLRKTWTIPRSDWGKGFAGATVWSTPAVDPATKLGYVGTSNPFVPQHEHEHANAVLKIDLDRHRSTFGRILGSYHGNLDTYVPGFSQLPCYDIPGNPPPYYPQGLGSCGDIDMDFGANPNLFTDAFGRTMVASGQKSGVLHVFDASTMRPAWSVIVGPPSSVGGIVGSTAYDGRAFYGPITPGGYVWSVGREGGVRWVSPVADGVHWGESVAVANGIVYTVDLKGFLDAYDARSGIPLVHRPLALGSGTGTDPVLSWGNVSVARNTIYAGVGITSLSNGFVVALRPGGGGVGGGPTPAPGLPAAPTGVTVVAGPGAYLSTYATPVVAIPRGTSLSFTNADLPQHDVTSTQRRPDGTPLFGSRLVGLGEVAPVTGVDRLAGGTYAFYCTVHPGMQGTLVVAG